MIAQVCMPPLPRPFARYFTSRACAGAWLAFERRRRIAFFSAVGAGLILTSKKVLIFLKKKYAENRPLNCRVSSALAHASIGRYHPSGS